MTNPGSGSSSSYGGGPPVALLFADAVERAAVGMAIVSADGLIRFANPLFSQILGSTPVALAGRLLDDVLRPAAPVDLERALAAGGLISLPVFILRADGDSRPATLDLAPLGPALDGADLLARLRYQHALQTEAFSPVDGSLAADEVVALIRHELREPLTSIRGYAELIADLVRDPEEMAGLARIIHDESLHLAWLLEDLSLLERIASRALVLEIAPIDLNSVVLDAARRLRPLRGSVEIALDLAPALPTVTADRDIMLQVVTGVIRDALRASPPEGTVAIATGRTRRRAHVSVSGGGRVHDTDDLERAFDLHRRTNGSTGRAPALRGFALPIARGVARLHGGRAWAERGVEGGATIHIALPAA